MLSMKKTCLLLFSIFISLSFLPSPSPAIAGAYGSPKKGVGGEYSAATSGIKVSWFYNWQFYNENFFRQGIQFIPMARVGRSESANCQGPWKYPDFSHYQDLIRNTARNHPGSYWLVGNEPEIGDQDNIQPECAFARYKAAMAFIRSQDPTAKFIVGGFHLNPTRTSVGDHAPALLPLKNEPGFKGWHVHIYLDSREEVAVSAAKFNLMLNGVLELMRAADAQGELWISEFLECYWGGRSDLNAANIASLMRLIVPSLENNSQVTRYAWFVFSEPQNRSWPFALVDNQGHLKSLGQTYGELATTDNPPYPGGKTILSGWNFLADFFFSLANLPHWCWGAVQAIGGWWQSYILGYSTSNSTTNQVIPTYLKSSQKVNLPYNWN